MNQHFPKPYEPFSGDINVKVDFNYVKISCLVMQQKQLSNQASSKTDVDKLDIDKLVPVPADLWNLSDAVKNDVVKKLVYDKLVAKVNSINSSAFVLKTKYDAAKTELEEKIPDASGNV